MKLLEKNLDVHKHPPKEYSYIELQNWDDFLASRTTPKFQVSFLNLKKVLYMFH